MENTITEEKQGLDIGKIEKMSPPERAQKLVHEKLIDWLEGDFREDLGKCLKPLLTERKWKDSLKKRNIKVAETNRDFGRVMHLFIKDDKTQEFHDRIAKILFSRSDHRSVINVLGKSKQGFVKDNLVGAISVLTFVDLLQKAGRIPLKNIEFAQICAPGRVDVENKIDAMVMLGDGVVRLIQLKCANDDVGIIKIDPDHIKENYFGNKVKGYEIMDMDKKRRSLEKKGIKADIFVILIPHYKSDSIDNAFGMAQKEYIVDLFREEALRERFIRLEKD